MKVGHVLVKRLLAQVIISSVVFLTLLGTQLRPVPVYQVLVSLESARSLGKGTLADALGSSDERIAARAALAIGRTKDPHGAALLRSHLRDKRAAVRAMSIYGLGLIASGADEADIEHAVTHDASAAARVGAIDALGRYESAGKLNETQEASAIAVLAAALKADQDPVVRARAATSFESFRSSKVGDFASRELVTAFAHERNQDVRWHLMWTMFRGYAVRVPREVFTQALRDSNELVRIEAVRAYGRLKNPDAIAALEPATHDASWRVQLQALESIKILKGEPPTDHLKEMPAGVHTPPVHAQITATEIAPLPRPSAVSAKPSAPNASQAIYIPKIDPATSALMTGPAPGPHPRVRIKTTKGTMIVRLFPEWAPLTVANFLNLTNRGYYDGLRWFRIVPDFVVQTGDPSDNGEGDAGYMIPAEENPLEQRSYVLSMGLNYKDNAAIRDSAGTQFYITLSPQLHLDRDFTVFGEVISGFDVLGRLIESDRMTRVEQIPDEK